MSDEVFSSGVLAEAHPTLKPNTSPERDHHGVRGVQRLRGTARRGHAATRATVRVRSLCPQKSGVELDAPPLPVQAITCPTSR